MCVGLILGVLSSTLEVLKLGRVRGSMAILSDLGWWVPKFARLVNCPWQVVCGAVYVVSSVWV